MKTRWLVIYLATAVQAGSGLYEKPTKAAIIEDDHSDGTVTMPFGVQPEQVADDCEKIVAILQLWDNPEDLPYLIIDDEEYSFDPADPAVAEEDVPPAT